MSKNTKLVSMIELAVLTAIVIVLQLTGTVIKLSGTSISLVLIPITFGAMILGPKAGAWLGFVFGAIVFISGVLSLDAFTAFLFQNSPVMTACICLFKSTFAGLFAGLAFKALKGKSVLLASFVAGAVAPIINTGLFILGGLAINNTISAYISSEELLAGLSVPYFLIIGCAGLNFILEFTVNLVLAPTLSSLYKTITKRI